MWTWTRWLFLDSRSDLFMLFPQKFPHKPSPHLHTTTRFRIDRWGKSFFFLLFFFHFFFFFTFYLLRLLPFNLIPGCFLTSKSRLWERRRLGTEIHGKDEKDERGGTEKSSKGQKFRGLRSSREGSLKLVAEQPADPWAVVGDWRDQIHPSLRWVWKLHPNPLNPLHTDLRTSTHTHRHIH